MSWSKVFDWHRKYKSINGKRNHTATGQHNRTRAMWGRRRRMWTM